MCMKVVLSTGIRYDNEWQAGSWTLVLFISLKIHFIFAFCKQFFYQLLLEHVSGDLCGSLMRLTHLVICRKCTIKLFPYFDVVYNWLLLHFVHMCPSNVQKSLDFFEIVLWTQSKVRYFLQNEEKSRVFKRPREILRHGNCFIKKIDKQKFLRVQMKIIIAK